MDLFPHKERKYESRINSNTSYKSNRKFRRKELELCAEFIVPGKNRYLCYISITGHGSAQLALNGVNNNVDTDDFHSFHLIMRVNVKWQWLFQS